MSSECSGNKFYKLYYNLLNARQQACSTVVSFGGAYSNHIHALAAAAHSLGLNSIGIIRGHRPETLSPTLKDAESKGMRLLFLNKKDYAQKHIAELLPILKQAEPYLLIPEGGDNLAGVRGCIAIAESLRAHMGSDPFTLCTASGTGSTLAGLVAGSGTEGQVSCLGISVLRGEDRLSQRVRHYLQLLGHKSESAEEAKVQGQKQKTWQVISGYHHGGYAKVSSPLLAFMQAFENRNQLMLEPVYTAKLLWAIEQLALQDYWPSGSRIVALHSGGLQGRRGFALDSLAT